MKNMKIFLLMLLTGGILQSCSESWLDLKQPIKPTLETFYTDTATAFTGLVGCYNSLQTEPGSVPMGTFFTLDIRSDDVDYTGNPQGPSQEGNVDKRTDFSNFTIYSDISHAYTMWNYGYRGVNTINKYMEGIAAIKLTPAQQVYIDQFTAEAKFMRAYFYFILVKNFGPVPLITKTLDEAEWYNQRRTPEQEVYAQIFKDLREAIPLLPLKSQYTASQTNRITKGTAQALLAKTLITQAEVDASSPNWAEAYAICKDIESSNEYDLKTNFKDIFSLATQFNSETVFDIVFEESITIENSAFVHYLSPRFVFIKGKPDHSRKMEFGFGLCGVTEDLANQFGYNQDSDSLSYVNMNDGRGRYTFWARWDRYCTYSVVDKLTQRPETRNELNGTGPILVDDGNYYQRKYNREALAKDYFVAGSNLHVIRYAEIILLEAEAAYYTGNEAEALRLLNLVRERAFREAISVGRVTLAGIQKSSSGAALLADIWQERRLELAAEGDRFYDLKRTHRLETVLKAQKPGINFVAGKHELLPIPSSELSKSPYLTQNNGY
jgi:hypothetical protein